MIDGVARQTHRRGESQQELSQTTQIQGSGGQSPGLGDVQQEGGGAYPWAEVFWLWRNLSRNLIDPNRVLDGLEKLSHGIREKCGAVSKYLRRVLNRSKIPPQTAELRYRTKAR